jgi:phosphatidylinositol dimannoside acyltransferase
MRLTDFLNSHLGLGLGFGFSWMIKPRVGYPVACWVADLISARRSISMVRAVRANQWIVHDRQISAQQLNLLVRDTFRSTARSLYEFWHLFDNPKAVLDMVDFEPSFLDCIRRARQGDRGTIIVVPHMSNFDLVGRAAALRGLDLHILSYPRPPGGYRWQNRIREIPGILVTPMSVEALRQASQTLNDHRVVLTGVDRPLPTGDDAKYRPRFFGRPAALPVFHIRLALKHDVPIVVLGGARKPDGCYSVWASDPIPMQRSRDLIQETVQNAEAVLAVISDYIRRAPDQWAMYYPVWPETLDQAPGG